MACPQRRVVVVALLLLLAACKGPVGGEVAALTPPSTTTSSTTTSTSMTTSTTAVGRVVLETGFKPFVIAGGQLTLTYPTARVEVVGFHESKREGARQLVALPGAGRFVDMESRDRATLGHGAADVESDPDGEVRAPVTGTIKRGGTYTLYCKYTDSFLVIAPDAHPDWEVKLLHINTLLVAKGQRVEAGVTPVAARPARLPFASQAEEYSAAPAWPHVHVEVDDPSIKNPPGVGGEPCS